MMARVSSDRERLGQTWEAWVGDQSVAEFLAYCKADRETEVREYVRAVVAGDVFGPIDDADEIDQDETVGLLLDYIEWQESTVAR